MEDWTTLRNRAYDPDEAWDAFQQWIKDTRNSQSVESFLKAVVPVFGQVLRSRFRSMQSADRDDVCSIVAMNLSRKVKRNKTKFLACGKPDAFTALMVVTVRNLIYDHLRCSGKDGEVPPELFYRRPQLSVPKAVELKLILAELPDEIAAFALTRDRFGFGERPIRSVVRLLVVGKDVPLDMLRNWLGVDEPERCVAFVTLMARWFLHKYRDKFSPVLDGELAEQVASVDQNCHVL